ncbi:MAG: hypothetical protein HYX72_05240 [Acidobacteria bacterium]|nr:hypothetical protein [Acidobacteriota bacterium]
MAEANQAFEDGDADRLTQILERSEIKRESSPGIAVPEDIVRAVRKTTLKMRLHLTFLERFNSDQMKRNRGSLAKHLLATSPDGKLREQVMSFFEEMHLFLHDSYVDEELIWSTFGFCAVRWWAVCEDYVLSERESRNDKTLFAGFQELAVRFSERDARVGFKQPAFAELIRFLENERELLI